MPQGERTSLDTLTGGEQGATFSGAAAEFILGKLDTISEQTKPRTVRPRVPWEACHPIWQTGQIVLTSGAGTLAQPNLYGPELPYWWDLRSLRLWGWSAGTVTVFRNFATGEELVSTGTVGEFTWSAQEFLTPQDSMVFVASGITGVVNVTFWAVEVATAWLPEYLM